MLLMIDNFDSFTHTLVSYFRQLGQEVRVKRNNAITIEQIKVANPKYIVLSPGPCTPKEAGICLDVVAEFAGHIPILGVCLGHQVIAQHFGLDVVHANTIMHGKVSSIAHNGKGVFTALPTPLDVTRYHSLSIRVPASHPEFEVTAWTDDEVMAIQHRELAIEGVQFHPESVLTQYGLEMLQNFIQRHG